MDRVVAIHITKHNLTSEVLENPCYSGKIDL